MPKAAITASENAAQAGHAHLAGIDELIGAAAYAMDSGEMLWRVRRLGELEETAQSALQFFPVVESLSLNTARALLALRHDPVNNVVFCVATPRGSANRATVEAALAAAVSYTPPLRAELPPPGTPVIHEEFVAWLEKYAGPGAYPQLHAS